MSFPRFLLLTGLGEVVVPGDTISHSHLELHIYLEALVAVGYVPLHLRLQPITVDGLTALCAPYPWALGRGQRYINRDVGGT